MNKMVKTGLSLAVVATLFAATHVSAQSYEKKSIVAHALVEFPAAVGNYPTRVTATLSQVLGAPVLEAPSAPPRPPLFGGGNQINPPFFFQAPDTTVLLLTIDGMLATAMEGDSIPNDSLRRIGSHGLALYLDTCSLSVPLPSCGPLEVTWTPVHETEVNYNASLHENVAGLTGGPDISNTKVKTSYVRSNISGILGDVASIDEQQPGGFPSFPKGGVWLEKVEQHID